jgi:hypothetical protein
MADLAELAHRERPRGTDSRVAGSPNRTSLNPLALSPIRAQRSAPGAGFWAFRIEPVTECQFQVLRRKITKRWYVDGFAAAP